MRFAILMVASLMASQSQAQSFSCRLGGDPACLNWGETICSSSGKCVSQEASCFDSYQCNYEGFTCKSNVTECVDAHNGLAIEYDTLLRSHNDLVGKFNSQLSDQKNLVAKYDSLSSDFDDLSRAAQKLDEAKAAMEFCIELAEDLDAAKSCQRY